MSTRSGCEQLSVPGLVFLQTLIGALDLSFGFFMPHPVGALDRLSGLEVLVHLEEMLDFKTVELRDIFDLSAL